MICKICGKPTKFFGNVRGYATYCGNSCAQLDPETRQKYKDTCLVKYGAENIYASDYGKQKIKETLLKNYNVEYPMKSNEIKNKIKTTNLERYGNACAVHNDEIWSKAVAAMKNNSNYSKLEDYLEQFFIKNNIEYYSNYSKDKSYPFHCDFYLPNTDTFIEINGYWHHNTHFYDGRRKKDKETLTIWIEKSKTKPQYKVAIDVWTKHDIIKRKYAKRHKLNYIVLWNKKDIENFINNFTN